MVGSFNLPPQENVWRTAKRFQLGRGLRSVAQKGGRFNAQRIRWFIKNGRAEAV